MSTQDAASFLPLTPLSFEILLSLADGPRHGYGIITESEARSGEAFASSTGTLYLAIQRLHKDGLLRAVAAGAGSGSGAKASRGRTYELTVLGRAVAVAEAERLAARVLDARAKALLAEGGN
jgi:DNA-binding PadR family transcriptional regulator